METNNSYTKPGVDAKRDAVGVLSGDKRLKSETNYRHPEDTDKICLSCKFYEKAGESESSCSRVVGIVKAEDVCDLWGQGPDSTKLDEVSRKELPTTAQVVIKLQNARAATGA